MQITGLNFLVAEDHEFQRFALAAMLKKEGAATVLCGSDARASATLLASSPHQIDVVICDLRMPGSDGLELLRLLRDGASTASVIVASALEPRQLESIATLAKEYGIKLLGVIEKPITPMKLRTLLARRQRVRTVHEKPTRLIFSVKEIAEGLRSGQFEPFFQPKIGLNGRKVTGAEALARWRHPVHGIIEPAGFLSIVENNGLMDELTSTMLEQAATWSSMWRKKGLNGCVSVNLSARTMGNGRIAAQLAELTDRHGLEPETMILEITESAAMDDVGATLEALARLRMTGFGLSIDDYGTGYSSMLQLTRVAFTELKIDRSFVASAELQPAARIILGSCIDMAHKLGMTSVAEGVETQEQLDLLLELGCDMAQGYFFSRPMPATEYLPWLQRWESLERL